MVWSGLEGAFTMAVACQICQNERVSVPNPVARRALCSWGKGKALPFDRRVFGPCAYPCGLFFVFLFAKLLNFLYFSFLFCFQDGWTPPQSHLSCKRGGLWEWMTESTGTWICGQNAFLRPLTVFAEVTRGGVMRGWGLRAVEGGVVREWVEVGSSLIISAFLRRCCDGALHSAPHIVP